MYNSSTKCDRAIGYTRNVPTLILYSTADHLIPTTHAVEYAKLIADSQLIKMDGVGHDIPAGICEALRARLRYRIHPEIFKLFATI